MRFNVDFELKENWIGEDYRRRLLYIVKNVLKDTNVDFYSSMYENTEMKKFSFATKMNVDKHENGRFILKDNKLVVTFTSDDELAILRLMNSFMMRVNSLYSLDNESIKIKRVYIINNKKITSNEVVFKTLSNIIVKDNIDRKDVFYDITDIDKLKQAMKKNFGYDKYIDELDIEIISKKDVLVKFYSRYIMTNLAIIKMRGHKELLQKIYERGLGSKLGCGFGTLEIV